VLKEIIAQHDIAHRRVFDLGCGNGATANMLSELSFEVTGIDLSESGIALGHRSFPHLKLDVGNVYDDLVASYGQFPLVYSLEVIEHCFDPRRFTKTFYNLIVSGGVGVLSTPYHDYWKNLALAVTGKWDKHLTVLWQGGYVRHLRNR
jgi:2-polyprenyl-3-methyl-5-hydroxy-6-metoxy-1,4-benzoquinol methylase